MKKLISAAAVLTALFICALLIAPKDYGNTKEMRAFLSKRRALPSLSKSEMMGNTLCTLKDGRLSFQNSKGEIYWESDKYWFVEDFDILDVDGDKREDILFSLYKSYSFFEGSGKEDSPQVKCHLFLYTSIGERAKALWCSSNLPRPVLSFSLEEGEKLPYSSGAVLKTAEGSYEELLSNSSDKTKKHYSYVWQGWGFAEV